MTESPLHRETVDLGGGVRTDLFDDCVQITSSGHSMTLTPLTRQQANRLSIALKKASRRLQAIGMRLPEEPSPSGNRNEK